MKPIRRQLLREIIKETKADRLIWERIGDIWNPRYRVEFRGEMLFFHVKALSVVSKDFGAVVLTSSRLRFGIWMQQRRLKRRAEEEVRLGRVRREKQMDDLLVEMLYGRS